MKWITKKRIIEFFKRNHLYQYVLFVLILCVLATVTVYAVCEPPAPPEFYTFTPGTVAKADEVNQNFCHLLERSWELSDNGNDIYYNKGNVGIGTTGPSSILHINTLDSTVTTIGDAPGIRLDTRTTPGETGAEILFSGYSEQTYGTAAIGIVQTDNYAAEASDLYFATKVGTSVGDRPIERMRITKSGNVGIGTTNPSYRLHVDGDIAYTGNIYDVSDIRLKENINPIENAVEKVSSINGVYFNYKGDFVENREVGVIAQEVEKVLPEVVSEDAQGYKSVDYSKLTPLLIEAIKAQQCQIIDQEAMIEELKTENGSLKQEIEQIKKALGL